ncbi:MAG TPA: nucleotidyl transferase AbiEii/AbiGii toxin family protein [Bacteroidales bacterium]|nr:nucleotidyl transferase AbiEii/AbiGii toxin family protein [Bacteroidales bacterium]
MQKNYLADFVLAGGTALAFQIGHRRSIDLDMFTGKDFDSDVLLSKLLNDYEILVLLKMPNTLICNINNIKVDFIRFKYPPIRPLIEVDDFRLFDIIDIAAMKIDAITGRGNKKDFFDLYFLLKQFKLTSLLEFYKEKYQHQTLFHVIRSISYFKDAENNPEPLVFDTKVTWSKVKKQISKELQNL